MRTLWCSRALWTLFAVESCTCWMMASCRSAPSASCNHAPTISRGAGRDVSRCRCQSRSWNTEHWNQRPWTDGKCEKQITNICWVSWVSNRLEVPPVPLTVLETLSQACLSRAWSTVSIPSFWVDCKAPSTCFLLISNWTRRLLNNWKKRSKNSLRIHSSALYWLRKCLEKKH